MSQVEGAEGGTGSPAVTPMVAEQTEAMGALLYESFLDVAVKHNHEPPFESVEFATAVVRLLGQSEGFASFVASEDGEPLALNFLDERNEIAGVGPVAVGVQHQGRGLGKLVMEALLEQAEASAYQSVRLLQSAYNRVSFSLYSRLGFDVKDGVAFIKGRPPEEERPADEVREGTPADLDAMDELSLEVLGFRRRGDLELPSGLTPPLVLERQGHIVGFTCRLVTPSGILLGPAVARDEQALRDLILGAARGAPVDLRVTLPVSLPSVLRWALEGGFVLSELDTLMVRGAYERPAGAYLPSAWY